MTRDEVCALIQNSTFAETAYLLEGQIEPALRVVSSRAPEATLEIGQSKFGGLPDLPPEYAWPETNGVALAFLAQFRLPDIASYHADNAARPALELDGDANLLRPFASDLPASGILYFFCDAFGDPYGYQPEDRYNWRVLHYEGEPSRLRRRNPPPKLIPPGVSGTLDDYIFQACSVSFDIEQTLPPNESLFVEALSLTWEEDKNYRDLLDTLGEAQGNPMHSGHHLLGHPFPVQDEMQWECELISTGIARSQYEIKHRPDFVALREKAKEWRLLLQLDTDEEGPGWMWGDVGTLYFWIRTQDLAAQNFANVWLVMQCC